MSDCDKKYCCCKCKHQRELNKHPLNTNKDIKGSILESTGYYACLCPELEVDIIFDKKHGECEMFQLKNREI